MKSMSYQSFYSGMINTGENILDVMNDLENKIFSLANYGDLGPYQLSSTPYDGIEESEVNWERQASTMNVQSLYQDPNPEIIQRPALESVEVYTQRVSLKFLQPPPLPPPGVSLSKNNCM